MKIFAFITIFLVLALAFSSVAEAQKDGKKKDDKKKDDKPKPKPKVPSFKPPAGK